MTWMCDICEQPADVLAEQLVDPTSDGPTALCAVCLARFAVDLLASRGRK